MHWGAATWKQLMLVFLEPRLSQLLAWCYLFVHSLPRKKTRFTKRTHSISVSKLFTSWWLFHREWILFTKWLLSFSLITLLVIRSFIDNTIWSIKWIEFVGRIIQDIFTFMNFLLLKTLTFLKYKISKTNKIFV